jgi:enoyl-CoA hydratase/carnithine racemase
VTGFVRLDVEDRVGVIRLDRPPANAIDLQLGLQLQEAIREAASRDDVGAVVVWGGPAIFAAGADIKAMASQTSDEVQASVESLGDACDLLETIEKVSIAAVNGYALGGGLELALGADLRVLADDAAVGQPEVRIGLIPGAGGTQRLTRLLGPGRAADLVLTGRQVGADEAERLGLATLVVPAADVLQAAVAQAAAFAGGPREALAAAKAAIRAALETPERQGYEVERAEFLGLFGTADRLEGMRAFLEKREPRFGADRS